MENLLYLSGEELYELAKARPEWNETNRGRKATREELVHDGLRGIVEPLEEGVEELLDRETQVRYVKSERNSSNSWASYSVRFDSETTEESIPPTITRASYYGSLPLLPDYETEKDVLLDIEEAVLELEGDHMRDTAWKNANQLPTPDEMSGDQGTGGYVRWKYNPQHPS